MKTKIGIIISILVFVCCTAFASQVFFSPTKLYTKNLYQNIDSNFENIHSTYPDFTEIRSIGTSVKGKYIKALKVGKGEKSILINGAHHGREMMTAVLCAEQAKYLAQRYSEDKTVRKKLDTVAVWFVPLVNPDGVQKALTTSPGWKANGRGVDLNRNYPTQGEKPRVFKPSPEGYHGTVPFSEPETIAMRDFCYEQNFETSISYHSAGEVIYWWFYQQGECLEKSLTIVKSISNVTKYKLMPIQESKSGYGFTDWFIKEFNRPAFTLEIGKICNRLPLKLWEYNNIWNQNKNIPILLIEQIIKVNGIPLIDDEKPPIEETTPSIIQIRE